MNNEVNMILIFSHELTATQADDARASLGVCDFIKTNAKIGDVALVQGDFGATYSIVNFCKKNGIKAIYATTKRTIKESMVGDKVVKNSIFEHVKFREYR